MAALEANREQLGIKDAAGLEKYLSETALLGVDQGDVDGPALSGVLEAITDAGLMPNNVEDEPVKIFQSVPGDPTDRAIWRELSSKQGVRVDFDPLSGAHIFKLSGSKYDGIPTVTVITRVEGLAPTPGQDASQFTSENCVDLLTQQVTWGLHRQFGDINR
jgi:hypothetical protein